MSGGSIPYHLRVNKYVDRQLFMDCLDHILRWRKGATYGYATLGGPFLADLRAVHSRFGLRNLLSIEADDAVYDRQKFNRPLSLIDCEKMNTGDFVTDYGSIIARYACDNWAIWLDYVEPSKREKQLGEVAALVAQLGSGDVIRVTMNAALHTLATRDAFDNQADFQGAALQSLRKNLGRFFPGHRPVEAEEMTAKGICDVLLGATRVSMLEGISGEALRLRVVPLSGFRYTDGLHQMLTVTAVIAEVGDDLESASGIRDWPYFSGTWEGVREIRIPDLSVKERIAIDELMFKNTIDEICDLIPFRLEGNKRKDRELVGSYVEHYLRYPSFLQVLV